MMKLKLSYREPAELAAFLLHNRALITRVSKAYKPPDSPYYRVYVCMEVPRQPTPDSCAQQPDVV